MSEAAEAAAQRLEERLAKRLNLAHSTQVCSGLLTHAAVARTLSSDSATMVGSVFNPHALIPPPNNNNNPAGGGGLVVPPNLLAYLVTIRNVDRNEEYTHPHPLQSLLNWHIHFVDLPIMRNINVHDPKNAVFPSLQPPVDRSTWTTARMIRDGQLYHVIVNIAPFMPLPRPRPQQDAVVLYLTSPVLPVNHLSYTTSAQTSEQRRAIAIHMAVDQLAKQRGFAPHPEHPFPDENNHRMPPAAAGTDNDEGWVERGGGGESARHRMALAQAALLHGDILLAGTSYASSVLCGGFESNSPETSAGAAVLPLVLRHLHFLLPALHPDQPPIYYDIIQPHQCAYIFQLRSVGGWNVLGAVNLYASLDALRAQFQLRDILADVPSGASSPVSIAIPRTALSIDSLYHQVDEAKQITGRMFNEAVALWRDRDAPSRLLAAPFLNGATGEPDIHEPSNDTQKKTLPPSAWQALVSNIGARLLVELLKDSHLPAANEEDIRLGNRFLNLWLMQQQGGGTRPSSRRPRSSTSSSRRAWASPRTSSSSSTQPAKTYTAPPSSPGPWSGRS